MAANPGRFVKHIEIDLPFNRQREVKHTDHFNQLVRRVEDEMINA
jgi:NitT/TauT family transport system ATP-binding protein